ncbi:hypothetical protein [Pseudoxanthomonas yeongjuensis]|uniref:hypothetical protein n=1 Tax=Pseudoxanthomonas yeongjuensis TaxID=377616 RepID=UPI00139107BD|nr:hypothetical protein [Pseudoxanthomonas yeongjuensis]
MAIESVAVSDPGLGEDFQYSEPDVFERIGTRLDGIHAMGELAIAADEQGPSQEIRMRIWDAIKILAEDTQRDLAVLHKASFGQAD